MDDFDLVQLELAFSYHIVTQIMDADGTLTPAEMRFIEERFPADVLQASGFVGPDGEFTQRWHNACGEALMELPMQPEADRIRLLQSVFQATLADGRFERPEGEVLLRAGRLLGLSPEVVGPVITALVDNEVDVEAAD